LNHRFWGARRVASKAGRVAPAWDIGIDGEELMIMKEADIMGHFEGGAAPAKTR
jgi:hypothetical protein